jgi:hypothetical protein
MTSNKPSGVNYTWKYYNASVVFKSAKNSKSFSSKLKGNNKKK